MPVVSFSQLFQSLNLIIYKIEMKTSFLSSSLTTLEEGEKEVGEEGGSEKKGIRQTKR